MLCLNTGSSPGNSAPVDSLHCLSMPWSPHLFTWVDIHIPLMQIWSKCTACGRHSRNSSILPFSPILWSSEED